MPEPLKDEVPPLREGRYVVTGLLGEGTQGSTLEAVDKRQGRLVAIKRFDVRGAKQWKDVELAEREARVLASLAHPALPAYVEHFEENGALYLVMERIDGESLASLRRRGAPFTEADAMRLLGDAAAVLAYLHGRSPPLIHRDLKPANVIRRPDGSFAFVDFGSVRERLRPEGGSTVVGTFGYMAPEQFQGRALPGTDVYAIGATVVAMLSGEDPERLPHQGLTLDVAAALRGRASPGIVALLARMLETDPDRRPADLAALLREDAAPRAPSPSNDDADRPWRPALGVRHRGAFIGVLWAFIGMSWAFAPEFAWWATRLGILLSVVFFVVGGTNDRRRERSARRAERGATPPSRFDDRIGVRPGAARVRVGGAPPSDPRARVAESAPPGARDAAAPDGANDPDRDVDLDDAHDGAPPAQRGRSNQ